MVVLRKFLIQAVKVAATDPRVQAKAVEIFDTRIKPAAHGAWDATKPKIAAAKAEIKDAASVSSPRRDPVGFARELRRRSSKRSTEGDR